MQIYEVRILSMLPLGFMRLFIRVFIGLLHCVCLWIPRHLLTGQLRYRNRTIITVMHITSDRQTFIAPPGTLI